MGFLPYKTKYNDFSVSIKAALAELVALCIFVFVGCGTAVFFSRFSDSSFVSEESGAEAGGDVVLNVQATNEVLTLQTQGNWGITTALAFGMAIMFLVYTFAHISGGQINCAVTLALVLSGQLGPLQGVVNTICQMVGAILGASFLRGVVPDGSQSSLGANSVNSDFNDGQAVLGEAFMTFVLCFVVLMCATDPRSISQNIAPFAIGMVVFAAHAVLLPVDGCSINPTRSFGPAVVSGVWSKHWIFWVGPIVGSIFAVPLFWLFRTEFDTVKTSSGKDADAITVNMEATKRTPQASDAI